MDTGIQRVEDFESKKVGQNQDLRPTGLASGQGSEDVFNEEETADSPVSVLV